MALLVGAAVEGWGGWSVLDVGSLILPGRLVLTAVLSNYRARETEQRAEEERNNNFELPPQMSNEQVSLLTIQGIWGYNIWGVNMHDLSACHDSPATLRN